MLSFTEKWSIPVVFAVLLHIGVLVIFYTNFSEKDGDNDGQSKDKTTEHSSVPRAPSEPASIKTQASISTVDNSKTPSQAYKKQEIDKDLPDQPKLKNTENSLKIDVVNNESSVMDSNKENINSTQKQQLSDKKLTENREFSVDFTDDKANELEDLNSKVGLLSIDTPKQPSVTSTSKNYERAKTEVEEINRQLSNAINEVKKRNQQEIDQLQQQQSAVYIRNSENNKFISNDFE